MSSPHKAIVAGLLLLAACQRHGQEPAAPGTVTGGGFTLRPATATLLDDDVPLPEASGVDAVRNNCTGCHSAAMILSQPRLTPEQWKTEVEKMVKVYRAPVDTKAVPAIEGYLNGLPGA